MPAPPPPSSASPPDGSPPPARKLTRRRFLAGSAALPLSIVLGDKLGAMASTPPKSYGPAGACSLPPYVLTRIWRGYDPRTSGQVIVVPHGRNFLGAGAPHASPWAYTQDVPMFWYGPNGVVEPGFSSQPITSADIAPTIAKILQFDGPGEFQAPDGNPMPVQVNKTPKLIVVLVWDAGGRFVLDLWPQNWPHLRGLKPKGMWFDKATVGSSPSNTAPIHATIGTGAFPRTHGIIDNVMKFPPPDGRIRSSWADGPDMLKVPALAELYQQAMGTDVAIGMAGSVSWHLGMVGHGNNSGSGPQPVVLLKNDSDGGDSAPQWEMPPSVKGYYRFFDHATTLPPLDDDKAGYFQFAETIDGTPDGLWRGKDVGSLEGGWASPARIPYQHQAIKSLIVQEEFGHHNETDLLFINYKVIDEIGHRYYASSDEMGDCVKAQDLFLQYFVNFLDKQVGVGEWLMLVTADHGHTAAPGVSGGYLINQHEVQRRIEALRSNPADPALLTQVRPMWLNIDDDELANSNLTYQDISKLIASLTRQQTRTTDDPSWTLTDEPVFDAAFAGSLLPHLSCWHPPAH